MKLLKKIQNAIEIIAWTIMLPLCGLFLYSVVVVALGG